MAILPFLSWKRFFHHHSHPTRYLVVCLYLLNNILLASVYNAYKDQIPNFNGSRHLPFPEGCCAPATYSFYTILGYACVVQVP